MAYMDPKDHLGRLGTMPRTLTHTVNNNHGRDDNYEEPPDERKNFPASSASSSVSNSISKEKLRIKTRKRRSKSLM